MRIGTSAFHATHNFVPSRCDVVLASRGFLFREAVTSGAEGVIADAIEPVSIEAVWRKEAAVRGVEPFVLLA
jgi:hypothetical protein